MSQMSHRRRLRWWVCMALVGCLALAALISPNTAQAEDAVVTDYGSLAVVMDLSGSMNDDDGTGTIKLDGAKEALVSVVRTQASRGDTMSLWTYPGGQTVDGCAAGSWEAESGEDPLQLAAKINSLTAGGGTPTGPALRAVADNLKGTGENKAVILLVSDGMSGCGTPPCDVAKELVSEGFQLTVQAMGFQVDAEGRQELECIANATQGAYYDASDAADLVEKIEQYGVPNLELNIDAPQTVASGDVAEVTVSVTNTSVQTIPGVSLSVLPLVGDDTTVLPAVVPPVVPIGNLPGDAQRSYSWRMPIGSIEKGGTTKLRAVASSTGFVAPVTKEFTITALGPDFGIREHTWLSQIVTDGSKANILIFGDSYSSGEGAGAYDVSTVQRDKNECHRTPRTYLANTDLPNVSIIACSGAVMAQVTEEGQDDQPPQIQNHLLAENDEPVDVAFMTIGGNDIHFAQILTDCLIGNDLPINPVLSCDEGWGYVLGGIALRKTQFMRTYEEVYSAINSPESLNERGRIAPLVILPYPNLVPAQASGKCGLDPDELRFAQSLINTLNETIENSISELRSDGLHDGIVFAGTVRTALGTHGMCTEDPHFNNPTLLEAGFDKLTLAWDIAEWGHLDRRGYLDITRAIQNWAYTQDFDPSKISPSEQIVRKYQDWHPTTPSVTASMSSTEKIVARPRDTVRVTASGLGPNSPAVVSIHSVPKTLIATRADTSGNIDALVRLPLETEAGRHRLVLEGFSADLGPINQSIPVEVRALEPWWLTPATVAAAGLFAASLILLLISLATRRRFRRTH